MGYFVYNSKRKEINPITNISESGVSYIAPNGARVTMELNRSWNKRILSFYKEASLKEIMKEIGAVEERKLPGIGEIDNAPYRDLQALGTSLGINPFGKRREDLIRDIKAKA